MNIQHLWRVLVMAVILLGITLFSLLHIQRVSRAQDLMLTKRLNKSSPVVRVGELISFTITLHNNANFTLTNVTLIDDYEHAVMAFAGALPVLPDVHTPTVGGLQWNNVAVPPIPMGETITFTVFFTVEHPETNPVVNVVRAQDVQSSQGAISDSNAIDQIDEATGGSAPVVKFMSPPTSTPQVGLPVTFTQIITNDGLAILTSLPLTDTYDPNFLEFNFAVPPPTITSPGQLIWTDLTDVFGDLAPFQTVVVTTVFTATTEVVNTIVNQASTEGARDQFDNDLTGGQASAGITIIGSAPTPTRRVEDDDDDDDDDDNDNETIPATPSIVVTVTPETAIVTITPAVSVTVEAAMTGQDILTGAQGPRYLPETGRLGNQPLGWWLVGVLLFLGLAIFKLRRRAIPK